MLSRVSFGYRFPSVILTRETSAAMFTEVLSAWLHWMASSYHCRTTWRFTAVLNTTTTRSAGRGALCWGTTRIASLSFQRAHEAVITGHAEPMALHWKWCLPIYWYCEREIFILVAAYIYPWRRKEFTRRMFVSQGTIIINLLLSHHEIKMFTRPCSSKWMLDAEGAYFSRRRSIYVVRQYLRM